MSISLHSYITFAAIITTHFPAIHQLKMLKPTEKYRRVSFSHNSSNLFDVHHKENCFKIVVHLIRYVIKFSQTRENKFCNWFQRNMKTKLLAKVKSYRRHVASFSIYHTRIHKTKFEPVDSNSTSPRSNWFNLMAAERKAAAKSPPPPQFTSIALSVLWWEWVEQHNWSASSSQSALFTYPEQLSPLPNAHKSSFVHEAEKFFFLSPHFYFRRNKEKKFASYPWSTCGRNALSAYFVRWKNRRKNLCCCVWLKILST